MSLSTLMKCCLASPHSTPLSLTLTLSVCRLVLCVCVCVCALGTCKDSLRTMQRRDIALSARTRTGLGRGYGSVEVSVRSLAQAQTESVFSSACLCICSLGPACESSNFLNSPPLTVSRPSATLSLGRVVARVCAGFALYSFISFTYFFYVCILSLRFIAECCPLNLYLPLLSLYHHRHPITCWNGPQIGLSL